MRETPSGGVGSIQDQGVNYIQLNIQPSIPLLNTELRNATLNKDHDRSTALDPAQVTTQPGRAPAAGRVRVCMGGSRIWDQRQFRGGESYLLCSDPLQ